MAGECGNFSGVRITTLPEHLDEFMAHPNYMNHVRQIVIDVLAEMADSNIMNHILSQITGEPVSIPPIDCKLGDLIRESEYIIS